MYEVTADSDGVRVLSTQDETAYLRLMRSNLGLAPYEQLDESRILNADPDSPEMRAQFGSESGSPLDPVAQIELYDSDGAMIARFVDGRPIQGAGALKNIQNPSANPQLRPQFSRSAAGIGIISAASGISQKIQRAQHLGLKRQATIYQNPATDERIAHIVDYEINIQGTALEPVPVSREKALSRLNALAPSSLSKKMQAIQNKELIDFYHKHHYLGLQ